MDVHYLGLDDLLVLASAVLGIDVGVLAKTANLLVADMAVNALSRLRHTTRELAPTSRLVGGRGAAAKAEGLIGRDARRHGSHPSAGPS